MQFDLIQIASTLIVAGAIYGGIRADIRSMHERISSAAESAAAAHARLDAHLEKSK